MRASRHIQSILIASIACFFAGCGASAGRVEEISKGLSDAQSAQASTSVELNEIRDQLRSLTGRIEELEHRAMGKTKELEQTIEQLGSRVPPPAIVPTDLLEQDERKIVQSTGAAAEMYQNGLRMLRTGNFSEAQRLFAQFVQENPETAFTDNALLWSGICYEGLGQSDRAVVSYSEVFQRFPAEDRAPLALFRLGQLFLQLGSKSDAVVTFEKLTNDYRNSEYARTAQQRLAELRSSEPKKRKK